VTLALWALATLAGCHDATDPAPLVVMVSLDTLRADRVGALRDGTPLTPSLDRLATEGIRFVHARANANETRPSHAVLFTGRPASTLAPLDTFRLPPGTPTLAGALASHGWQTAAFVAGGHLARGAGLEQGFDSWNDTAEWGSLAQTGDAALGWLDRARDADRPAFLFVHGYDAHERYLKPSPFGYAFTDRDDPSRAARAGRMPGATAGIVGGLLTFEEGLLERETRIRPRLDATHLAAAPSLAALRWTDADRAHLSGLYDGGVAWADAQLGRFLAGLDARGLLDDATVIVLSDHGEALGEAGFVHHRFELDDAVLDVPLVVRLPGGAGAGRVVDDLVDLSDVTPTVLARAGIAPLAGADGHDLGPALAGTGPVGRTTSVAEGGVRQIAIASSTGALVLSGLSATNPRLPAVARALPLDAPAWTRTGSAREADTADTLRQTLVAWRETHPAAAPPPEASVVRGTRAAGYWSTAP
jgi:arylsulfatase A-like enzyme